MVRYELHLRADQDIADTKEYWSSVLGIPLAQLRGIYLYRPALSWPPDIRPLQKKGLCLSIAELLLFKEN